MKPFLAIADITVPGSKPFAVLSIDPTQRAGAGCKAVVVSVHDTWDEAEESLAREGLRPVNCECPQSYDGRHHVDTSMEEGPNNCFHCGVSMRC